MIQNLGLYFVEAIQMKSEIENESFNFTLEYLIFLINCATKVITMSKNDIGEYYAKGFKNRTSNEMVDLMNETNGKIDMSRHRFRV